MIKRIINWRPSWKLHVTQQTSGNYYPVTTKILLRDPKKDLEVAVLTDRAQGGTSLHNGQIELMVCISMCLFDWCFITRCLQSV